MRDQLYKKGQSGNPKGKPKGARSKFTTLGQAFLDAYNDSRIGGTEGLIGWILKSEHNRALFYQWITKMLPSNLQLGNVPDAAGKAGRFLIEVVHVKGDPGNGNGNGNGNGHK
jgi:hypothetical protein